MTTPLNLKILKELTIVPSYYLMSIRSNLRTILISACVFGVAACFSAAAGPLPLTGVNIAGGEFWWARKPKGEIHPQYGVNYNYPTKAEVDYFAGQGMNFFRYQFLWETLQPTPRMPLDTTDLARLKESVNLATSKNLIVLLDPHNYARYYGTNIVGQTNAAGHVAITAADFADFWGRLAAEFKDDPHVWFGLVNEPHDMPTQLWFDDANASIAAIRATGAKNMILVPGNSWTGAHSWTAGGDRSNAKCVLTVKDPLDYWAIEVHQYMDEDNSGTHRSVVSPTIGSERLKTFADWCRQNKMRAFLGEFGVPVVTNGEATLNDMLQSMERDSDVWLGWTWWAAGARWGNYLFTIEPKRDGTEWPQMAWLRPHLNGVAMPKYNVAVKNGQGQGEFESCAVRTIEAAPAPAGMVFKKWTGDTAWLNDPAAPKTTLAVPFKNIQVEAVFEKAP
jgi:endoglucanase